MSSDIVKSLSRSCEILRNAVVSEKYICVSGSAGVGKTTLVRKVLSEQSSYLYIYITCDLVEAPTRLYIKIYNSLLEQTKLRPVIKVPELVWNFDDFQEAFMTLRSRAIEKGFNKIFIVLDGIESFKSSFNNVIMCLTMMEHVSIVFITKGPQHGLIGAFQHNSLRSTLGLRTIFINLPAWSTDDIIEAITKEEPSQHKDIYKNFVHNVVSLVYRSKTKSYVELRKFCQENFNSFLAHRRANLVLRIKKYDKIEDESLVNEDLIGKFEIEPSVATSLINSFLEKFKDKAKNFDVRSESSRYNLDRKLELNTVITMLALYFCAYTTPSDDRKNFVKLQKKKISQKENINRSRFSHPFTLERFLNVQRGLAHLEEGKATDASEPVDFLDSTLNTLQKLEDLKIIHVVGGDGIDSTTRYRLSNFITRAYIDTLSRSIGFQLDPFVGM